MPTGLGFHPYFPRNAATLYRGLHCGEATTFAEGLPVSLCLQDVARDWWDGLPVDQRMVDTVYVGREEQPSIAWPDRNLALVIDASSLLGNSAVYTPRDATLFCVEPVSHITDAINRVSGVESIAMLPSGQTIQATVQFTADQWNEALWHGKPGR